MLHEGNNSWYSSNKSSRENSLIADAFICFKIWRDKNIVSPWRDHSYPTSDTEVQGSHFVCWSREEQHRTLPLLSSHLCKASLWQIWQVDVSNLVPVTWLVLCEVSPRVYAQWLPTPGQSRCALAPASWLEKSIASAALHLLLFSLTLPCLSPFFMT